MQAMQVSIIVVVLVTASEIIETTVVGTNRQNRQTDRQAGRQMVITFITCRIDAWACETDLIKPPLASRIIPTSSRIIPV